MSRSQGPYPQPQSRPQPAQPSEGQADSGRPQIGFLQGRSQAPQFGTRTDDAYAQGGQDQGYRPPQQQPYSVPQDSNYLGQAAPQPQQAYAPQAARSYPPVYDAPQQAPQATGAAHRDPVRNPAQASLSAQPSQSEYGHQRGFAPDSGLSQLSIRPGQVQPQYPQVHQESYRQQSAPAAPQHAYGAPAWPTAPAEPDSRGFDFGSYLNQGQAGSPQHGGYADDPQGWGDGYDGPTGSLPRTGTDGQYAGYDQAESGGFDEFQHDEGFDTPAPRRSGMKIFAVSALAVAVLVGGGLAYAYRTYVAVDPSGEVPIVRSDAGPARTKPTDPGGKQFAYTESKVMGRLGDPGTSSTSSESTEPPAAAETETDSSGARRVTTISVGRDGTIVAPPASPEPPASIAVPGLMVDGMARGPSQQPIIQRSAPAPTAPPQATASLPDPQRGSGAPAKPVVIAKASTAAPEAETYTPAAASAEEPPAAAARKPTVAPKRIAVAAPAASAPPSASGGSGFVAVIASVPASSNSRMDALKQFADMQQKYGSALQNKTPDVQEANLGDKGLYHRLLVGPPGSREQASAVCSGLKTAGYASCWVTSY